jgi:hypothetical protein
MLNPLRPALAIRCRPHHVPAHTLGEELADLPEGLAKENKLLEILQCFHGYVLKYVSMILHGHMPIQRYGAHTGEVNRAARVHQNRYSIAIWPIC